METAGHQATGQGPPRSQKKHHERNPDAGRGFTSAILPIAPWSIPRYRERLHRNSKSAHIHNAITSAAAALILHVPTGIP